jgi:hypothetical protein
MRLGIRAKTPAIAAAENPQVKGLAGDSWQAFGALL